LVLGWRSTQKGRLDGFNSWGTQLVSFEIDPNS